MTPKHTGLLFVLSGPSGAGKGTVKARLFETVTGLAESVSATTRAPRHGEAHGKNYYFLSDAEFKCKIANDEFAEHVHKFEHRYGTLKSEIQRSLDAGLDVLLEIETIGAANIKKAMPQAILIFITPSDPKELERRLIGRGSESEEMRKMRIEIGRNEMLAVTQYDYIAINDNLDACVNCVKDIIHAERSKVKNNRELIAKLHGNLK